MDILQLTPFDVMYCLSSEGSIELCQEVRLKRKSKSAFHLCTLCALQRVPENSKSSGAKPEPPGVAYTAHDMVRAEKVKVVT